MNNPIMNEPVTRGEVLEVIANYKVEKYGASKLLWDLIYELPSARLVFPYAENVRWDKIVCPCCGRYLMVAKMEEGDSDGHT